MSTILITGACGAIGRHLRKSLNGVYDRIRYTDVKALDPARDGEEVIQADLSDRAAVAALVKGCDTIVHMAASLGAIRENGKMVGETSWDTILQNNIIATYNIFEAAYRAKVKRIVYASSIHAHGMYRKTTAVGDHLPPRPDSRYGLSKAFGEATGRFFADKYGMEVVSLRIATYKPEPTLIRDLGTWLSPRDAVRLVRAAIDTPDVHFDVLYGVSNNRRGLYENPNAKRFGYFPQDDSEVYRDRLLARNLPEEPILHRTFHAAHLAESEWDGDMSKIT
ncbi:MAG: NAD(P)-dependent oxidoreductase [Roseovarius sp.]|nr:NAD(P)-dependent oxidoreductase [Roseovarius sp.]